MHYTQDFFLQRSFEVVWAVFRVGEFVGRKELRRLLEKRALEYLSNKTVDNLGALEEMVRLAMQIGEIKDINGRVLLRETNNLREALSEIAHSADRDRKLGEESIEKIFENPSISDSGKVLPDYKDRSGNEYVKSADKFSFLEIPKIPFQEEKEKVLEYPLEIGSGNVLPDKGLMTSYERKQVILNLLKSRNMCGMREIIAVLPNISERTLRYDVKGLVDRKLVERVGRGGPDSFLRLSVRTDASV